MFNFGWSFKKDTNDSRESASIDVAKTLLDEGVNIKIYDPMVSKETILNDIIKTVSFNAQDQILKKLLFVILLTQQNIQTVLQY